MHMHTHTHTHTHTSKPATLKHTFTQTPQFLHPQSGSYIHNQLHHDCFISSVLCTELYLVNAFLSTFNF